MNNYTFDIQSIKDGIKMLDFPVNMVVETSAYCNLKCVICPHRTLRRAKGNMSTGVFRKIVDEAASVNPGTTLWLALMGEPLMNPEQLIGNVRYAKSRGLKDVRLNTNGILLNHKLAERLIEFGVDYVLLSIDAITPETYSKIRVHGDFAVLNRNVNRLLAIRDKNKSKTKVVVQFIVMDENESEADAFKDYWLSKGAIVKLRPKLSWGNTIEASNLNLEQKDRTYPCPWLMRTMSIQWTGRLAQCDFDYEGEYSPGDVRDQSLKAIWNGEIRKRREKHWNGDFSHLLCKECRDWQVGRAVFYGGDSGEHQG